MKKNLIAITLSFESNFNKKLIDCWKILREDFGIKYISSRSKKPHIGMINGYVNDLENFINTFEKLNFKKFYLRSKGLGLFLNEKPLLYLRWEQSEEAINLYKILDKNLNFFFVNKKTCSKFSDWVPKTSIAYYDLKLNQVNLIQKKFRFLNKENKVLIKNIDIMIVDKIEGEKIIFSKSF